MNAQINQILLDSADKEYQFFNKRIVQTNYEMYGVRMPAMKKLAKEVAADAEVEKYLRHAEFTTYEHILLYGFVLARLKKLPLTTLFGYLDPLILKFDSWAHVDTVISSFKIFNKHQNAVLTHFLPLKTDPGEFTKRTFVIILMDYFLDGAHIDMTLKHLQEVQQGQYYVDMGIAWTLCNGLIKHYDKVLPVLEERAFSKFVHNKAIQKARESFRVPEATKAELNKLKIK